MHGASALLIFDQQKPVNIVFSTQYCERTGKVGLLLGIIERSQQEGQHQVCNREVQVEECVEVRHQKWSFAGYTSLRRWSNSL